MQQTPWKVQLGLLLSLSLLLSACLSSLVPPQNVDDLFGIDGEPLVAQRRLLDATSEPLDANIRGLDATRRGLDATRRGLDATKRGLDATRKRLIDATRRVIDATSAEVVFDGALIGTFDDLDLSLPVSPRAWSEWVGFAASISLTGSAEELPESLTLARSAITVQVSDGSGSSSVSTSAEAAAGAVLERMDCNDTGCSYSFSSPEAATRLLFLELTGSEFRTLYSIITGGSSSNDYSIVLELAFLSDTDLPEEAELTVVLQTSEGQLRF